MRGQLELSERDREAVTFAVDAMLELADESPFPPDWRMVEKMRPLIEAKFQGYRRSRTAALVRQYEASI